MKSSDEIVYATSLNYPRGNGGSLRFVSLCHTNYRLLVQRQLKFYGPASVVRSRPGVPAIDATFKSFSL